MLATIGALNDAVPDNGPYSVNTTQFTLSRDATRGYFQTFEQLTADDTDSSEDVYFSETSDAITQTVPPGGTASTGSDPELDRSARDRRDAAGRRVGDDRGAGAVPVAAHRATACSATRRRSRPHPNTPPTDDQPDRAAGSGSILRCSRPATTSRQPGAGSRRASASRSSGTVSQVGTVRAAGTATPSPCIDSRTGGAGNYVEITVLTLSASDWNFGLPNGTLVVVKEAIPERPDRTSISRLTAASARPSFSLDDDSDGTLSNTQTFDDLAPGDHYSVTESVPAGWSQDSATCDDGSPVSNIDDLARRDRHLHIHQLATRLPASSGRDADACLARACI